MILAFSNADTIVFTMSLVLFSAGAVFFLLMGADTTVFFAMTPIVFRTALAFLGADSVFLVQWLWHA